MSHTVAEPGDRLDSWPKSGPSLARRPWEDGVEALLTCSVGRTCPTGATFSVRLSTWRSLHLTPFEVPQVGQPSQTLANRTSTRGCRPNLIDICALAPSASVQIRAQVDAALEAIIRQCVKGHSSFLSAYGGKLVEGEVDDLVDEIAAAFQPAIVDASKTTLAAVIRTVVRYGCKLAAVMEEREVAAAFAAVVPPLAASVESTEKLNSEAIAVIGVEACMAVKTVYGITLRPNQRVSSAWVKKTRDSLVRGDLPAKSFVLEKLRLENNVMDDDHNEESFLRFTVKFHETKDHDITSPSDFFPACFTCGSTAS